MRSRQILTSRLGVPLIAIAMVAGTCFAFEQVARFAEVHLNAFLWRKDDTLGLFSAHNYVGRGRGRLMIHGPSEAREALFPEEIGAVVKGLVPYQHSQSNGTLAELLVTFEYIERAYGPTGMPRVLVLGVTPRFVASIHEKPSPLYSAINRFSPHFVVADPDRSPRLVPRTTFSALRARVELLSIQPDRYRRGLFAVTTSLASTVRPSLQADRRVWGPVRQAKYLQGKIVSDQTIREWLATGDLAAAHAWDPEMHRDRIIRQIARLRDYASTYGIQIFVVNLPERSWHRELYDPRRYASYLSVVRTAFGATPFIDLRTFLRDDEFYDTSHTTWDGGKRVSKYVAAFIEAHRGSSSRGRRTE